AGRAGLPAAVRGEDDAPVRPPLCYVHGERRHAGPDTRGEAGPEQSARAALLGGGGGGAGAARQAQAERRGRVAVDKGLVARLARHYQLDKRADNDCGSISTSSGWRYFSADVSGQPGPQYNSFAGQPLLFGVRLRHTPKNRWNT